MRVTWTQAILMGAIVTALAILFVWVVPTSIAVLAMAFSLGMLLGSLAYLSFRDSRWEEPGPALMLAAFIIVVLYLAYIAWRYAGGPALSHELRNLTYAGVIASCVMATLTLPWWLARRREGGQS